MKEAKHLESLIGDYANFFTNTFNQLNALGIDIGGYKLSHLGVRVATWHEYEVIRDELKKYSESYVENVHNGRPIAKLFLADSLDLPHGFEVKLIELMPPKPDREYAPGLEHLGVVIGNTLEEFASIHKDVISYRQDQGDFCKPYIVELNHDTRAKFYDLSLKDVVEKEGNIFISI